MEYVVMIALFAIGMVAAAIRVTGGIFWVVLAATLLSWGISKAAEIGKNYEVFNFFYTVSFVGRIVAIPLGIVLILIKLFASWVF